MDSTWADKRVVSRGIGSIGAAAYWPVAVAILVRITVWAFIPSSRLASDEDSYFLVGTKLLTTGEQDVFWPPVTGWLIAFVATLLQTTDARWIRLAWIAMDIGCLLAVRVLAGRVGQVTAGGDTAKAARLTTVATLAYALYLPAISFSQFATSETPALLLVLLSLVVLTRPQLSWRDALVAGLLAGTLAITRPSLLPLLVFLPLAALLYRRTQVPVRLALVFVVAGAMVIGAVVVRNYVSTGAPTIAQNSAYNLYIGNRDLYAEDLDLFHPVATRGQIEFRRQYFTGEITYPSETPQQLQRRALTWIVDHPAEFTRRALGRLARVFAPKTDVLELLGGERTIGVFAAPSLALLALANVQWVIVLFVGLVGVTALWRLRPDVGGLFLAAILGSLPLCLIAISKPRYAFTFEPLLLIGAVLVFMGPHVALGALGRPHRWILAGCAAFLAWGWAAWLIFAVTSRVALANAS
jgi:hypothetical protein